MKTKVKRRIPLKLKTTVDRAEMIAWSKGVLLCFKHGEGIIVNEHECQAAYDALLRGETVLLRNGATLTGTELVDEDGAVTERIVKQ